MPTRREQLQGYRFVTRRIVSAMLSGEPESTVLPMRRLGLAAFASVMIATIVFAGVGVYGILRPGGKSAWKKDNTLVIERESGARYIYQSGTLHPVLNYASARLIVGAASPQQVSANSLRDVPRGAAIGIVGAPDSVPSADALVGLPWIVCSSPKFASSTTSLATELMVGRALPGGSGMGDKGLLVTEGSTDGTMYLLWHDKRYRIPDDTALTSLGLTGADRSVVGTAMISAVPQGRDLAVPRIPGKGEAGKTVDGTEHKVGDVFRSGDVYYVLMRDGLVSIHEVTAKLLLAGAQPTQVPANAVAGDLNARTTLEPKDFPTKVPEIESLSGSQPAVCAGYRGAKKGSETEPVTLRLYEQAPKALRPDPDAGNTTSGPADTGPVADRIVLPGGHGALVREEPQPGVTAGTTVYLVTDEGFKYALVTSGKKKASELLGFGGKKPVPIPVSLLDLVPTGPALDPDQATQFNIVNAPSPTASPQKQTD